uniref:Uncharacterized protein n=1 Tax=Arundo donax TaxID=35708 RepID=A0A0A8ZLD0_ARUDO
MNLSTHFLRSPLAFSFCSCILPVGQGALFS